MHSQSSTGMRARLGTTGATRVLTVAALAVAALVVALSGSPFALRLANIGGLMAIAALALTVLTGTAGLLSLGHAAFLGMGAFTAGILATQWGVPFPAVVFAAALTGLAVGAALAFITVRISGLYLAVGTFALHYVVALILNDIEVQVTQAVGFLMPPASLPGLELNSALRWWIFIAACIGIEYLALDWLVRSHIGRAWIVSRDKPAVAGAMGVSLLRSRVRAFALTSAITVAAGAIGAYYLGIVIASGYTLHLAIMYVTVVVVGGLGNLPGAIIAAYAITLLPYGLEAALSASGASLVSGAAGLESMALGIILIAVLLRLPTRAWTHTRDMFHARR